MSNSRTLNELRHQSAAYLLLSFSAASLVALHYPSHTDLFLPYLGPLEPLFVIALVFCIGAVSIYFLVTKSRFLVLNPRTIIHGMTLATIAATLFALEITLADLIIRFPEDLNVSLPHALLFYPAIAYVVEIMFHALPLMLILLLLNSLTVPTTSRHLLWLSIILTACMEPTFQIIFLQQPFSWAGSYIWLHVFLLNFIQLYLFRRFDFLTMITFRLVFYAFWHIIWGWMRLQLLF